MPGDLENGSEGVALIDSSDQPVRKGRFPNLISAVSQIQRYAMIEREGGEIPVDFLTIEGQLNFFNVGLGSGFVHGIFFLIFTIIALPVISDDILRTSVSRYLPLAGYKSFLFVISLTPVMYSVIVCVYLTRYHIGRLTRRAIDNLLVGRLVSKVAQGLLYFVILIITAKSLTPEAVWKFSYNITFRSYDLAHQIYRVVMNTRPNIHNAAWETLGIFMIAVIVPFVTIWMFAIVRKVRAIRQRMFWNN